jgi:hypothetical protein
MSTGARPAGSGLKVGAPARTSTAVARSTPKLPNGGGATSSSTAIGASSSQPIRPPPW